MKIGHTDIHLAPTSLAALVRGGILRPLLPSLDSGHTSYAAGRLFIPAGAEPATWWQQSENLGAVGFTVAFRYSALWAHNDGAAHILLGLYTATDLRAYVQKNVASKISGYVTDGADYGFIASAAQTLAAGTLSSVIFRATWAGTLDLNLNGVNASQASAASVDAQTITEVRAVGAYGSSPSAYIGPVLFSPTSKSAGWVTALQADPTIWTDIGRLVRDFMDVGDYLTPFGSDSVTYEKTAGSRLPFYSGQLICDGNSLTGGAGVGDGEDYPAQLAAALSGGWVTTNLGVGGQTIQDMLDDAATQVDPLYDPTTYHNSIVCCWEGCNYIDDGYTGAQLEAKLAEYCAARQAAGYKVVVLTVLPFGGAVARVAYEPKRTDANTLIRANWATYADALADVAADSRIGDAGDQDDTDYYNVDMWHMTAAGYAVVAGIVQTAVEGLL